MKYSPGLRSRIIIILVTLLLIFYFSFNYLFTQVDKRDKMIGDLVSNYQPSLNKLFELQDKISESGKTFTYYVIATDVNKPVFQEELNKLFREVIPPITNSLFQMSEKWEDEERELIRQTSVLINDSLYNIISTLSLNPAILYGDREEKERVLARSGVYALINDINQNVQYLFSERKLELSGLHEEISQRTKDLRKLIIITSLLSGLFIFFSIMYILNHIRRYIRELSEKLESLAGGEVPEKIEVNDKSEFAGVSRNFNRLFDYLKNLTVTAREISRKNFSTEFSPLSEKDELGKSFVDLQESLKIADREERKYKEEEKARRWKSDSIVRINDILRTSTENLEDLGFKLVKAIVEITSASAAGLFILEGDNETIINLKATYAFDRKKLIERSFKVGEGLVGRCVQENESIYLTDIPPAYMKIRTGLGETEPRSLLLVPLKLKDQVIGVLELASVYAMSPNERGFIDAIAENIASAIDNLKANIRTTYLLEQTQQQAEEMLSQEEEMRQNLEELEAIRDQYAEREKLLLKELEDLKKSQQE